MSEVKNKVLFPVKITAGVAVAINEFTCPASSGILEKIQPCLPTGQTISSSGYIKNIGGKTIVLDFSQTEILELQEKLYEAATWNATRSQGKHIWTALDACCSAVPLR